MATITSSGGFRPSTKDTPLDVRTRVRNYSEIQHIQNAYLGMEITVLEDETNNGKKTKYEVVNLIPNATGVPNALIDVNTLKRKIDIYEDNGNLIVGDSNNGDNSKKLQTKYDDSLFTYNKEIPGAINELKLAIDNIDSGSGSGSGSGLTTAQAQQLQTAYEHSQSYHVSTSDVSMAVRSYVNSNIGLLKGEKGDKGDKGDAGADAINPNFTIGTVTTLPSGSNATVTLTGTFPNLVLNFGIPGGGSSSSGGSSGGTDEPGTDVPVDTVYMYYGRISLEEAGGRVIQYSEMTERMITTAVSITKAEPRTLGKTSMGLASDTTMGDYITVAVPTSTGYTVTKDNGFGGKVRFLEETSGANGISITINGIPYKLYGEIILDQSEIFIYID